MFQNDLEATATSILPQLQVLLHNTSHNTQQERADAACKLVQIALHESASAVLSFNIHTKKQAETPTTKTPETQKHSHPNPTFIAVALRLEIQKLRNTINAREKEISNNIKFPALQKICHTKEKNLYFRLFQ